MQWGLALFYGIATLLALRIAWHGPERFYACALFANVAITNIAGGLLPAEYGPGMNLLTEFVLFEMAALSSIIYHDRLPVFLALMFISVVSITISTSQALSFWPFGNYEIAVNVLLLTQCAVLGRRGIANVVGRIYDVVRSGRVLRHAMDRNAVPDHGLVAPQSDHAGRHDNV